MGPSSGEKIHRCVQLKALCFCIRKKEAPFISIVPSFVYIFVLSCLRMASSLGCKLHLVRFVDNILLTIKLKCFTYLLAPRCRVLLEKLTGLQLVKKFLAFHGTRRFITALTSVRHLSLSWASPIQSIYPHPTSWRSILILPTHLRLGLHSGLFPSGFPTKTLYTPLLF